MNIYEDSYLRTGLRGGVNELNRLRNFSQWTKRPKNLDSYSSWVDIVGFFDRFEFFSFLAMLRRSEVKKVVKSRFFLYKLQWGIIRKSWDFGTFLTSDRPIIAKNENFSNRSKIPERYINEVSNAPPYVPRDRLSEKLGN